MTEDERTEDGGKWKIVQCSVGPETAIKKEENLTKRDSVTCCFSIQPERDPGDDDQKDTWAVHL